MAIPDSTRLRKAAEHFRQVAVMYTAAAKSAASASAEANSSDMLGESAKALYSMVSPLVTLYSDGRDSMNSTAAALEDAATAFDVLRPKYNAAVEKSKRGLIDVLTNPLSEVEQLDMTARMVGADLAKRLTTITNQAKYAKSQRDQSSFWRGLWPTFYDKIGRPVVDTLEWVADTALLVGETYNLLPLSPAFWVAAGTGELGQNFNHWKSGIQGYYEEHITPTVHMVTHPRETVEGLVAHYKANPGDILIDSGILALSVLITKKYPGKPPIAVEIGMKILNPPGPLDIPSEILGRLRSLSWFDDLETKAWNIDDLDATHPLAGGGHIRDRHISMTDQDLIDRAHGLRGQKATRFTNEEIASAAIRKFMAQYADEIDKWIRAGDPTVPFEEIAEMGYPIGEGFRVGANGPEHIVTTQVYVKMVIGADGQIQIITAVPVP